MRAGWSQRLPFDEPLFDDPLPDDPLFVEPLFDGPLNEPLDDLARGAAPTGWFDRFPSFVLVRDGASAGRSGRAPLFEAPLLAAPFLLRLFWLLFWPVLGLESLVLWPALPPLLWPPARRSPSRSSRNCSSGVKSP